MLEPFLNYQKIKKVIILNVPRKWQILNLGPPLQVQDTFFMLERMFRGILVRL